MGDRATSIAALIAFIILSQNGVAIGSCWASNPNGDRVCQQFIGQHGLEIELCEDTPGDCAVAGYRTVPKQTTHQKHRSKQVKSETSDEYQNEPSVRNKDDLGRDSGNPGSALDGVLILAAIAIAIVLLGGLFGLDARTSLLAALAGFILGLFGVGDRRRRYRGWW